MMPRMCAVLPCSAALARQIHHPDTQRVISWGLGNTAATRGDTSMKARQHAEAWSPLRTLDTLDCSKTRTHAWRFSCRAPKSCAPCVPFDSRAVSCFYLQARRNAVPSTFKTCCTAENQLIPRPACYMNETKTRRPAKTFPTQLILKRSPGRSNFRFATQLLQIQSSFWLSGWLAAPPNKAPIVWNL